MASAASSPTDKLAQAPCARHVVAALADAAAFARLKDTLYKKDWVVYAKAPFRNPGALFRYLGLYTHRVAISNRRLLHVDDAEVVFRTREKQVCRLAPLEFMRRFLQHVLPRGFVKIRHFGLLAAGNVNTKLCAARADIEQRVADRQRRPNTVDSTVAIPPSPVTASLNWRDLFQQLTGIDLGLCPDCGGPLMLEPLSDDPVASARAPPP